MIKAVIFDMDGIIIDSEPLWMEAEIQLFGELGLKLTEEDCKKMQGVKIPDVIKHWYSVKPWTGMTLEEVEKELIKRVKKLIEEKGKLMPGVVEVIKFFKDKGLPMAVASSSTPELIEMVLKKFDLLKYFKFFHSSMNEKRGKPYPDIFLTTANKLGVKPQNCLVFEDSENGVLAAKRAGMITVAVPYPENYNRPGYKIADIKLKSLKEWNEKTFELLNKLAQKADKPQNYQASLD